MLSPAPETVTVAEYLFARLRQLGVGHVFGVPGDFNLRLLDVLLEQGEPSWVGTANELGAAYAADGYGRERGFAALVTTYGVGELSAINGTAGSYAEQVPVLHIVGAPATTAARAGLALHHTLLDGDFDHFQRAAAEVTCAQAALGGDDPSAQIDEVLQAMLDSSLPGYLRLPDDVVEQPVAAAPLATSPARTPSSPAALREFADRVEPLLGAAHDVVVLAGTGVRRAGAEDALRTLATERRLCVATLIDDPTVFHQGHPLSLGLYRGALGSPRARAAVEGADVLIRAGARLWDMATGGFTADLEGPATIELALDHAVVDGVRLEGVGLVDGLNILHSRVPLCPKPPARADHPAADHLQDPEAPLTQAALWPAVAATLEPDDTIVADIGTAHLGITAERLPAGTRFVAQSAWCSIGYALAATLGVALARPERRAVLLTGDGAAQMTIQELGTIARRRLHPIIVLVDNNGYTIEREIRGPDAPYNDVAQWNWRRVVHGLTDRHEPALVLGAATSRELDEALRNARAATDRLVLIHARLDARDVPEALTAMFRSPAAAA